MSQGRSYRFGEQVLICRELDKFSPGEKVLSVKPYSNQSLQTHFIAIALKSKLILYEIARNQLVAHFDFHSIEKCFFIDGLFYCRVSTGSQYANEIFDLGGFFRN